MIWTIITLLAVMVVCYFAGKNRKFSGSFIVAIVFISLGTLFMMCYPLLVIGLVLLFLGYCFLRRAPKTAPKAAEKPAETKPITVC